MTTGAEKTLLYYPSIDIKDSVWLRNAVLYWDKVSSIVPSYTYYEKNRNNPEIAYLETEGIYEPIYPIELQRNQKLLDDFRREIFETFSSRIENNRARMSRVHVSKISLLSDNAEPSRVYLEKMPAGLSDYLVENGIAQANDGSVWVNMRYKDAQIYMAMLAKYLAKVNCNTEIGTDSSAAYLYPFNGGRRITRGEMQLGIDVALQKILPCPNQEVSYERIVDFKRENAESLRAFRLRLNEYQIELNRCEDETELIKVTQNYQYEMENDLREIGIRLRKKKYGFIRNTMHVAIPLGFNFLSTIGLMQMGIPSVAAGMAGTTLGAIASQIVSKPCLEIDESRAYLFKARESRLIQ